MSVMERPSNRPRSKSGAFSIKSDKSASSRNSKPKIDLKETPEEKRRLHLSISGKANPNAAMNEDQPVAAALEAPTMDSLSSIQHVDTLGNPISEPDLSNPTRPRWERPLDTIRSFEAAIDGEFKRRAALQRPNTGMFSDSGVGYGNQSRRSSYFGVVDQYQNSRYSQAGSQVGGYYGRNRDSFAENGSYGYGPQQPTSPPVRMRYDRRQQSEPVVGRYNNENVYPSPGYQRSRDTVNTGGTTGSSEPWANSTDPSSESSSIDRMNAVAKQESGDQYGHSGYGGPTQRTIMEEGPPQWNGYGGQPPYNGPGNGYQNQPPNNGMPPPPPPHDFSGNAQRPRNTLIKLGGGNQGPPVPGKDGAIVSARPALQSTPSEKKKSWLKRTFSKGGR